MCFSREQPIHPKSLHTGVKRRYSIDSYIDSNFAKDSLSYSKTFQTTSFNKTSQSNTQEHRKLYFKAAVDVSMQCCCLKQSKGDSDKDPSLEVSMKSMQARTGLQRLSSAWTLSPLNNSRARNYEIIQMDTDESPKASSLAMHSMYYNPLTQAHMTEAAKFTSKLPAKRPINHKKTTDYDPLWTTTTPDVDTDPPNIPKLAQRLLLHFNMCRKKSKKNRMRGR